MRPETQHALNEINRVFYAALADDFSETRNAPWAGWERLLPGLRKLEPRSHAIEVLDVGCGNGRFGAFLRGALAQPLRYLGIDFCEALLAHARALHAGDAAFRFESRDVLAAPFEETLPPGPADLVALFGLLHHIPGFETRRALLEVAFDRLAPGGLLIATAWRFGASERFRARFLDWNTYATQDPTARFRPDDLEPGDHLLGWGGSALPRYCHFVDRDEFARLVDGLGGACVDEYDADGKTGDLNHYVVLQRS